MKKISRILFIIAILLIPNVTSYAIDEISEELMETKYENEVPLSIDKDSELKLNISENEVQNDEAAGNTEMDFELFKGLDEDKTAQENKAKEESLFTKILHSEIVRTDVPSYLLKDELTFDFAKGPISRIQPFAAFRGSLDSLWASSDYTIKYKNYENQIGAYGTFRNPDYKFQFTFNPIPIEGTSFLERFVADAFIVNESIPHHKIIVGNSRVQTGVEGGASSYVLPFVARSQIARNFGNTRSLAVKLVGNYQYIDYTFSGGSSARYITNGFPGAEFNGWVNFKPFGNKSQKYGKFIIGGGYNTGHHGSNYNIGSAYISYNYKKLWTNFEASIADGYNGSNGVSSNRACGWAYTLGWKLNPHLQIIGRVDQFDPNREASHDLRREYTIGLNWFIKGQALKIVLNYVFCDYQGAKNSHRIILATQVLL